MAGKRRLHGDTSRLDVSNLAHQDDIRVLAKDRLETGREVQASLLVGLDLID